MKSKVEILEERLHEEGLPLTIQRRLIMESLEGRKDHPTADQVYESVRGQLPGVSKTTVYRVLETFVQLGVVRKVDHPGSSARFDPRTEHHHHLICEACGRVADYEPAKREKRRLPDTRKTGFSISNYSIHFTGLCGDCRRKR